MRALAFITLMAVGTLRGAIVWPSGRDCAAAEQTEIARTFSLPDGTSFTAKFEITSKGNGGLYLPGLLVRVFDVHDDGLVFDGSVLRCEWSPNGMELIVSGVALRTDEKNGRTVARTPVRGVFRYSALSRRFVVADCSPEIYTVER